MLFGSMNLIKKVETSCFTKSSYFFLNNEKDVSIPVFRSLSTKNNYEK